MKILVAVDGSDYSRMAIEFVASRQTLLKSNPDIQVVNVQWPLPANPARIVGMAVVREYYADEAEKALRPARRRLQKAGFSPTVRFAVGRAASAISATADKDNVDLLVLGSHGHSALGGMLLGSVTNEVLVRTKRAMLIVRGKAKSYADSLRVGIAVDGSPYGPAAVKYVLRHAQLFGATPSISLIHIVHTYDLVGMPSVAGFAPPAFTPKEVRAMQDKAFEAAMRPLRKLFNDKVGVTANEVRLVGDAGDELSAYANKRLDLLVMGSHGVARLRSVQGGGNGIGCDACRCARFNSSAADTQCGSRPKPPLRCSIRHANFWTLQHVMLQSFVESTHVDRICAITTARARTVAA